MQFVHLYLQPILQNGCRMDVLKEFSLPIKGLKNGFHSFSFQVGAAFFQAFETAPIQNGQFDVTVEMDKREGFFELTFDFDGTMETMCDRCTASIDMPFGDTQYLTVKYSAETQEEDADIVFIHPDAHEFNLAQYIYEFICLAEPLHKVYNCENDDPRPCDLTVLQKLEENNKRLGDAPDDSELKKNLEIKSNPFEELKNLFNHN
jgi:uncharacterized metal-binding protein YceD (DUF177 family)